MSDETTAVSSVSGEEVGRDLDGQWKAWRASTTRRAADRPQVAKWLPIVDRLPASERPDTFIALVKTDLRHRIELNEFPTFAEYACALPGHDDEIRAAFHQMRPFDDYLLLSRLGSGGMGEVYRAQHMVLGSQVALKILKHERIHDEGAIARFRQEVASIGKLDHERIVRARDAREVRGHQLLIMDYVDGSDLGSLMRKAGALPLAVACEAIRQAAEGLAHAHGVRIIHRDIKPSNIIVSRAGGVKLLDFGLAKLKHEGDEQHSGLTQAGVMGTLDYMAPEQFEDASRVGPAADIYSLGCTLYHLLAERAPFADAASSSLLSKHRAHAEAPVPSVRSHLPDCPAELDALLAAMLAKRPEDRPANARDVAAALAPFASREALVAFVEAKLVGNDCEETLPGPLFPPPVTQAAGHLETRRDTEKPRLTLIKTPRVSRRTALMGCFGAVGLGCAAWLARRQFWPEVHFGALQEVVPLASLSGGWWFRETPWLTPGIRAALASAATNGYSSLGGISLDDLVRGIQTGANVDQTEDELAAVASHLASGIETGSDRSAHQILSQANRPNLTEEQWRGMLKTIVEVIPAESDSPTEVHLRAILYHAVADYENSEPAYERALELYAASNLPRELHCLATSDLALMLIELSCNTCLAVAQQAREMANSSSLAMQVWTQTLVSRACAAGGELTRANQEAAAAVELAAGLPAGHPLAAYARETFGWSEMDALHLVGARDAFNDVLKNRRADQHNAHAAHYVLHDRQALAMCQYFLGEPVAVDRLQTLVSDFGQTLTSPSLTKRAKAELDARYPNTQERYADCLFFGHFREDEAAEAYRLASLSAEQSGMHLGHMAAVTVRIRYKAVMALALAGRSEDAQRLFLTATRLESAQGDGRQTSRTLQPQEIADIRLYAAVAGVMHTLPQTQGMADMKPLLDLLEQRSTYVEAEGRVNRDEMGLLLVTARAIFETSTALTDLETAIQQLVAIEQETASISGASTSGPGEIRHYFTPYWKTALTALDRLATDEPTPEFAALRKTVEAKSR